MGVGITNLARKCFTSRQRLKFTTQCDFRGVSMLPLTKISLWNAKTQIQNTSKTSYCGSFYLPNWLLFYETSVYMWVEPYLSNSLYKSFLITACAIRSSMQWRPSNRKYPYVLQEMKLTTHTVTWTLTAEQGFCTFLWYICILGSILQIIARRPSPI